MDVTAFGKLVVRQAEVRKEAAALDDELNIGLRYLIDTIKKNLNALSDLIQSATDDYPRGLRLYYTKDQLSEKSCMLAYTAMDDRHEQIDRYVTVPYEIIVDPKCKTATHWLNDLRLKKITDMENEILNLRAQISKSSGV